MKDTIKTVIIMTIDYFQITITIPKSYYSC